jgi:hypothetical protein
MCVIAIVRDTNLRPSRSEIDAMWAANPQGGGVAWREDGRVKWKKGLSLIEMHEQIANLPTPFVAHFRVASVGDGGVKWLTHPFPIQDGVPLDLEGTAQHSVLFHNGHWGRWESQSREWLGQAGGRIKVPHGGGKWSDSRSMAFWAFHFGLGIFEGDPWGIREKVIVYSPEEIQIFGEGWKRYNGYIVSNDYWIKKVERRSLPESGQTSATVNHGYPSSNQRGYPGYGWGKHTGAVAPAGTPSNPKSFGGRDHAGTGSSSEVAPTPTPFQVAREEYETAKLAYFSVESDGKTRRGSKTQMKKKRKKWNEACAKFPAEYKAWEEKERNAVIQAAERVLMKDMSDIAQRLPN